MSQQPIKITNATDLLDVLPALLGFHPTESLCVLVLDTDGRKVALTARVDLPTTPDALTGTQDMLTTFLQRYGTLALVAYSADYDALPGPAAHHHHRGRRLPDRPRPEPHRSRHRLVLDGPGHRQDARRPVARRRRPHPRHPRRATRARAARHGRMLERAEQVPDSTRYTMLHLLQTVIDNAIPPSAWDQMVTDLRRIL